MSQPALSFAGVTKRFGTHIVLRGVDLRLERGEVVGFVGPNGAGKSTCLRLAIGLAFRDGGTVLVHGLDPERRPTEVRRRCSYLPGETSLYPNLTGERLLRFAHSGFPRCDAELARDLQDAFALPLRAKVRRYSAGMKQKLALIACLVPDVELYLLDEPDRNLDRAAQLYLRGVVHRLAARGKTILFCSHHLGEVSALAHRLIMVVNGTVTPEQRVRQVSADLRREVRLRVLPDTPLPPGALDVTKETDGSWRVRTAGDPLAWIAGLDPTRVVSIEIGATNAEALYRRLVDPRSMT
jgi:ABC-2 type transport system ATP-binding protein